MKKNIFLILFLFNVICNSNYYSKYMYWKEIYELQFFYATPDYWVEYA